MRSPNERRGLRRIHQQINRFAREGHIGLAQLTMEAAPVEYRAVVLGLLGYVTNCKRALMAKRGEL